MKKIILSLSIILGLWGSSCKKYLDVNNNPNSPTNASASVVLPLAIVNTASLVSSLNDYGSQTVGYAANAGGYGGFGASWTYNYTTTAGNGYWRSAYSTLENLQSIINTTQGNATNIYYSAASKIMKAYIFQLLVDQFNDVPYTDALQGNGKLRPTYDKASDIYPSLASLLDSAIIEINDGQAAATSPTPLTSGTDPLFAGSMTNWKRFANTLKLRLIIRASGSAQFANTNFSSDGFLTDDAIVNPGYALANSSSGTQVSPSWNTWVTNYQGTRQGNAWIPANYVFAYYDGHKLLDTFRGKTIYYAFPKTPTNALGFLPPNNTLTSPSNAGAWYSGGGSGTSLGNAIGVMKGPNMGEPLMLLAESDFLQSEADVRGILGQDAATDFNNGVLASFTYLYKDPTNKVASGMNPTSDAAQYLADNASSYLVNFNLATTTSQQTEAIITQKYIALNFIHGQETWNEYRRTGYPATTGPTYNTPTGSSDPYGSFTSTQSQGTRPDKLPTRLPYPDSETQTNGTNVPQGINVFTSTIFWAH
ncbi:MAG: SusD/RagB family nutrient-binding outer membrane lipoprotein [Bacteroidetes bacterium]|nr:SusD/RagB family nutrient-binding outer membrane lipoprotein [Bacteroidota bacterium]